MDGSTKVSTKTPDRKREPHSSKSQQPDVSPYPDSHTRYILHLQQTLGNRAVQRMMKTGDLQAGLTISRRNDVQEREADRVADEVMRMPDPAIQPKPT